MITFYIKFVLNRAKCSLYWPYPTCQCVAQMAGKNQEARAMCRGPLKFLSEGHYIDVPRHLGVLSKGSPKGRVQLIVGCA